MAYVCSQCGKTSRLPDYCCGKATIRQGNFYCKECGNSSPIEQECCSTNMIKM